MKHFLNDKRDVVREAIDGVLLANAALTRLDGYPAIKVVVRADVDKSKVAIISGGGAGHEPAHVGFVGRGMLTAAVSGEVFASPSVDAVLAAILAVTGDAGALLVVKNYTGDRLNFGLACERARALGKKVELIVVADDIAIPGAEQPRGVAGTLFVHKVAGHFAELGASLAEVTEAAKNAAKNVASIGLSLSSCTLPGGTTEERTAANEAELGLGIHGEPGVQKIALGPVNDLVARMVERLVEDDPTDSRLALLINNLGGVPNLEMSVVTKCVLESVLANRIDLVIGPAALMTALDMKGISLSLLRLDSSTKEALLSPVTPAHWPGARPFSRARTALIPIAETVRSHAFAPSSDKVNRKVLTTICQVLIDHEADLNALDAKVGDGDTGSTLAGAARSITADLDALPFADLSELLPALSFRLSTVMGGSIGVLLSIFLAAAGSALTEGAPLSRALLSGLSRMQGIGGAKLGDRTMIDALFPAFRALDEKGSLSLAAAAARAGADATKAMTRARAGRSSYLSADSLRDVLDPGAAAVALVFEALVT